jgi:hypothetical protein
MREQLYYYLKNFTGLTALVGTRIYPQRVPTGKALSTLSYTVSGRIPEYDQDGLDGENEVTVEFNCNAPTLGAAVAIADQVFLSMAIQNDAAFGETGNTVSLYSTTCETEFDNFDLVDGSEDGTRIVTQTYTIRYK